jgi:hypothetical protein
MQGLNGTYRTSDFYLSAFLLTNGFELQDIDYTNPRRCVFVFQDRPDRPGLVRSFQIGQATGNLADFIFHLKRAKRLLYSHDEGGGVR